MKPQLTKGNEAIVKAAVLAGARAYYGYPITPASEIAEAAALYFPQAGGVFIQAESEVASINMMYGSSAAGVRSLSASSGPGISLMQEGLSYIAGAGVAVRGGGHHARRSRASATSLPSRATTTRSSRAAGTAITGAWCLPRRPRRRWPISPPWPSISPTDYRNPAIVLTDGYIGQMMEPVTFARRRPVPPPPDVGRHSGRPKRART